MNQYYALSGRMPVDIRGRGKDKDDQKEPQASGKTIVETEDGDAAMVTELPGPGDTKTRIIQRTQAAGPMAVIIDEVPRYVPIQETVRQAVSIGEPVTGKVRNPGTLEIQRYTAKGLEIPVPEIPKIADPASYQDALAKLREIDIKEYLPFVGIGIGLFRVFTK